jgi:hypothetical protein
LDAAEPRVGDEWRLERRLTGSLAALGTLRARFKAEQALQHRTPRRGCLIAQLGEQTG